MECYIGGYSYQHGGEQLIVYNCFWERDGISSVSSWSHFLLSK
jgi:hypothetical protein